MGPRGYAVPRWAQVYEWADEVYGEGGVGVYIIFRPTGQRREGEYEPPNYYHMHITRDLLCKPSKVSEKSSHLKAPAPTPPLAIGC